MISYASAAVYGPYTQLETMADDKMQVIVYGLKNSGFSNAVKYGGYTCYKFSYKDYTVFSVPLKTAAAQFCAAAVEA